MNTETPNQGSRSLGLRTQVAARAGLATASLSKALGRGEGSVIGGRVTLAIDKNSLEKLAEDRTIALVSGTNGKTTTTSLLVAALATAGPVVTNAAGANMFGGMVSALSSSDDDVCVLEVDEGHVPKAMAMTNPRLVVLLNLSRDQLDRVGEVRMQAQKWRVSIESSDAIVVANADDPLVVWAAQVAKSVVWVAAGSSWRLDAASCPACGARIDWGNGDWACTACDLCRPEPHAFLASKTVAAQRGDSDVRVPLPMKLPGEVNRRNGAVAATAAVLLGADPVAAVAAISRSEGAGGRFTSVSVNGVDSRLILAKNPAGWTEALRIAKDDGSPLVVAINARIQDGRDPSWLWDVPFEALRGRFVVTTGERGRDVAVRLKYAGVEHQFVPDMAESVRVARHSDPRAELDVLANYSAFQDFRKLANS